VNQQECGFCQACRAFVELGPLGGISEHSASDNEICSGSFHTPATLVLGNGWVSWTIAANSYARSVLINPVSRFVTRDDS
jgi:hypothetical protein